MKTITEKTHKLVNGILVYVCLMKDKHDSYFVHIFTDDENEQDINLPADYDHKFNFDYRPDVETPAEEQIEEKARLFYETANREYCFQLILTDILERIEFSIKSLQSARNTITHNQNPNG